MSFKNANIRGVFRIPSHMKDKVFLQKWLVLLNIMMLSPDLSQNALHVKFITSIELNTKFVVSLVLESTTYKKKQNKKQIIVMSLRISEHCSNFQEHNIRFTSNFCQKYSEILIRAYSLVVSNFMGV